MKFFRRRKFVVNKNLQLSLLIISFFYVILFLVVIGSILFIPLMIELDKADFYSDQAFQAASKILYLHAKFWPAVLFAFLVIALHSIRTSHKIAGPLYRLNLVFETMRDGNLPERIQVRKRDYLLGEVDRMNLMLESLRAKMKETQEAQARLNEAISECKDAAGRASKDEILERLNDLSEKGDQLGDKLAYFKIVS